MVTPFVCIGIFGIRGILSFFKFASRCDQKRHESSLVVTLEEVQLVSCDGLVCSFSLTHVSKRWITILLQTNPGEHDKKTNISWKPSPCYWGVPWWYTLFTGQQKKHPKKNTGRFWIFHWWVMFPQSKHFSVFFCLCLLSLVLHNPCHLPTVMSRPWSPVNVTLGETEATVIFGHVRYPKKKSLHKSHAIHER